MHEIAQRADPECRIVYIDRESGAVAHSELLLEGNDRAAAIQANLRDVEDTLDHPQTKRLLDLDQPIGVLMLLLLLHFAPDSWDPAGIVARYRDRVAPGSYLALSHCTSDGNPAGWTEVVQLYRNTPEPLYPRSHEEVLRLFAEFELVEPVLSRLGARRWVRQGRSGSGHADRRVRGGCAVGARGNAGHGLPPGWGFSCAMTRAGEYEKADPALPVLIR